MKRGNERGVDCHPGVETHPNPGQDLEYSGSMGGRMEIWELLMLFSQESHRVWAIKHSGLFQPGDYCFFPEGTKQGGSELAFPPNHSA